MLVKTRNGSAFDEMLARGIAARIINCWPAAAVSICLAVTLALIGFLLWLVLLVLWPRTVTEQVTDPIVIVGCGN
jgi:ABC-type Mn2+/Zn2+ transport system permease subunit